MNTGLAERAVVLDSRASYHKGQVAHHRREARLCREQQREIEAQCRVLGIEIVYTRGGENHGGTTDRADDLNRTADDQN